MGLHKSARRQRRKIKEGKKNRDSGILLEMNNFQEPQVYTTPVQIDPYLTFDLQLSSITPLVSDSQSSMTSGWSKWFVEHERDLLPIGTTKINTYRTHSLNNYLLKYFQFMLSAPRPIGCFIYILCRTRCCILIPFLFRLSLVIFSYTPTSSHTSVVLSSYSPTYLNRYGLIR